MFKVDDLVIHSREGLSKIAAINVMNGKEYFLVHVNRSSGETIYVPVETADRIIRPLMDKKEADKLLKYVKTIEKEYNSNTKQRRDAYKRRISSGDVKEIAYLARQLYFYKKDEGKEIKLGPVDLDILNYAENMLLDEFAITYNVSREDISSFIEKRIESL